MAGNNNGRKFTDEQIREIRAEFAQGVWPNQLDAANYHDCGQATIHNIVTRKTYKEVE